MSNWRTQMVSRNVSKRQRMAKLLAKRYPMFNQEYMVHLYKYSEHQAQVHKYYLNRCFTEQKVLKGYLLYIDPYRIMFFESWSELQKVYSSATIYIDCDIENRYPIFGCDSFKVTPIQVNPWNHKTNLT